MMNILVFRERLRGLYQKYELYIDPIIKFVVAFIVFQLINSSIGYDIRLKKLPIVLLLSLLSAFTPSGVLILLAILMSIGHVYAMSKILSIIIILIVLIIYSLFLRYTPKLGYVVLAIPILYLLNIPYVVPIVLGLFAAPITIIPTSCGVIVYYLFKIIKDAQNLQVEASVEDTLQLYTNVANQLVANKQLFVTIIIFACIIVVTYIVRRMKFDYAHEIAVVAGALTCILGFLISNLFFDIDNQIGVMILGTLVSGILGIVIQFFHLALDYTGVEYVQFEDEDYYYYVKAVPKINVTTPQINVKRINPQKKYSMKDAIKGRNNLENRIREEDEDEDYEEDQEYIDYGIDRNGDGK